MYWKTIQNVACVFYRQRFSKSENNATNPLKNKSNLLWIVARFILCQSFSNLHPFLCSYLFNLHISYNMKHITSSCVCFVDCQSASHFRMVCLFGFSYVEALLYLIFGYQFNKELLSRGLYRGHDEELISHYRRECLLVSQDTCLSFVSCSVNVAPDGLH